MRSFSRVGVVLAPTTGVLSNHATAGWIGPGNVAPKEQPRRHVSAVSSLAAHRRVGRTRVLGSSCSAADRSGGPLLTAVRRFQRSAGAHEVIEPEQIDVVDVEESWTSCPDGNATREGADATAAPSPAASLGAWAAAQSPMLPSVFADVDAVDQFTRPRMLAFARRHRGRTEAPSSHDGGGVSNTAAGFATETLRDGELYHARLPLPVTGGARGLVDAVNASSGAASRSTDVLWAHGVSNTAKEAELLAAMHAELMADLLGYHVFTLPSKQHKHAEAARAAGRYASSPEDRTSGPSAAERLEQWPLPLRRVLTDEETEGGKWQLVNTAPTWQHYVFPSHTMLSPCMLDAGSRPRIEALFARAPPGSPSFARQLTTERVRTLTASSAAEGGEAATVAQLVLPAEVTGLADADVALVAFGKAADRTTAVLLACMHAELLLDAVHVTLFDDDATQKAHAMAAWSYGRPAPLPGAQPKNPSHVHLPDPLKELRVSPAAAVGRGRTSSRSAEEDWFHRHGVVTEQSGSFVETPIGESTAVEDVVAFLRAHDAVRADAPFLQVRIRSHIKSTVLLPLPDHYGIRGGVGIASNAQDADTLAAMHALDVLCMLGVPVKKSAAADAAWRRSRREQVPHVPDEVEDHACPSPPARRCTVKSLTLQVVVNAATESAETAAAAPPSSSAALEPGTGAPLEATDSAATVPPRRRPVKRAVHASNATAPVHDAAAAASERAAAELRLAQARASVEREFWSLEADSPDGYIMLAPGVPEGSAVAAYAISTLRQLDKAAKTRVAEYLASVGRRFDDVLVHRQAIDPDETAGRVRHRCVLKVPLPAVCGEPRLALGEADTVADAEHCACMHAELILDALGVCLYADPVKQKRHADACAQWGRWAPSRPGEEQPSSTPSPPPLRREHVGSLHWERQKRRTPKGISDADGTPTVVQSRIDVSATEDTALLPATSDAASEYEFVTEAGIDAVSKNRVQYYLRQENLPAPSTTYTTTIFRTVLLHCAEWTLPVAARLLGDAKEAQKRPEYVVKGVASTRRDAELLSWMHAERVLDHLGIPLFPNLPLLQAHHASRVAALGRCAPATVADPPVPLPSPSEIRQKPLRLRLHSEKVDIVLPPPPPEAENISAGDWDAYVEACAVYVAAKRMAVHNGFYSEMRAPRTGDAVIDAALAEAERKPLDVIARAQLAAYRMLSSPVCPQYKTVVAGSPENRVALCTIAVPGFEYLTGRGVGPTRVVAQRRAAMHAMAILRRVDETYEDTIEMVLSAMAKLRQSLEDEQRRRGAGFDPEAEENDIDSVSAFPILINDTTSRIWKQQELHRHRIRDLFIEETAWFARQQQFSSDGMKRAVLLFTICLDLAPPQVQQRVRLLPREEAPTSVTTPAVSEAAELRVLTTEANRPDATRVKGGATFYARVSIIDENGNTVSCTAGGGGSADNISGAYELLFSKLLVQSQVMKAISEFLKTKAHLVPEMIPVLTIPSEVRERIQACLQKQRDLSKPVAKSTDALTRLTAGWTTPRENSSTSLFRRLRESSSSLSDEAEASARLLEKLQRRLTNPVYLETFAARRAQLSIAAHKQEILDTIRDNAITILCGTTGCGKTTQVPQYILDDETLNGRGGRCTILVTQPRRLSAVSIAQRIAAERLESIRDSAGYIIRFDSQFGDHITLTTTGVLLRTLQMDPLLSDVSHLIIDEIHERDINSDFTLMLVRGLVQKRPDIRIVLMSATLNINEFQKYFGGVPVIQVEGHVFPVKEYFLEDLVPFAREHHSMTPLLTEAAAVFDASRQNSGAADSTGTTAAMGSSPAATTPYGELEANTPIDYATLSFAVEQALRMIDLKDSSILVFLPGWQEIRSAESVLERNTNYHILRLHSNVSPELQMKCFMPAPPGKVKIVLSTNISESGITIDDVGVVIDTGRMKQMTYSTRTRVAVARTDSRGYDTVRVSDTASATHSASVSDDAQATYSHLMAVFASRSNCVQRRGRAGRTRPGLCIRLFSREHFNSLPEFETPQLLRTPLDTICLSILSIGVGQPREFLQGALEPPLPSEVEAAMHRLSELGAVDSGGQLTMLGRRLAQLPIEPQIGKLILLGAAFRCLDTALTIAASDSTGVFSRSLTDRPTVRVHREAAACNTLSDTLVDVNGYNYWAALTQSGVSRQAVLGALAERGLSAASLTQTALLKRLFHHTLVRCGFISDGVPDGPARRDTSLIFTDTSEYSRNALDVGLVKSVYAACTLPNVAMVAGPRLVRTGFDNYISIFTDSTLRNHRFSISESPYLVFKSLMRVAGRQGLLANHLTAVSIWTVLLMGPRSISLEYDEDLRLAILGQWIVFRCNYGVVELVRSLKKLLNDRLTRKFEDPLNAENNAQLDEVCEIVKMLTSMKLHPNKLLADSVEWGEKGSIVNPACDAKLNASEADTDDVRDKVDDNNNNNSKPRPYQVHVGETG
ncbi:RNA editing associated helicase 2 [Novymonas esmeraldas]|uniref:RNA helicase n=1 Tax=Novymonas esmeraldas TaxID=1808958 RepID=A0AAW0EQG3_9TRYP